MRLAPLVLMAALASGAGAAEERYKISPLVLDGSWFATTGGPPNGCEGDGWWISIGGGRVAMTMVVHRLTGGKFAKPVTTEYTYAEPPPGSPVHLDLFVSAPQGDAGIDVHNGSRIDWVPAGKDHRYAQPSLYLRRCPPPPLPQ